MAYILAHDSRGFAMNCIAFSTEPQPVGANYTQQTPVLDDRRLGNINRQRRKTSHSQHRRFISTFITAQTQNDYILLINNINISC